ncbi:MAG: trypsin-like peptidase domain-containing protein [Pseudomonadota bacterium]
MFDKSVKFLGVLLCAGTLGVAPQTGQAFQESTMSSVVSVLPVWPGRAQGSAGAPPGVAPEGSGVVIGPGLIATAWHVVEPASRIDVRLWDGRVLPADLVAGDMASDIAVLSIDADPPVFEYAMDAGLAQPVCAVGNAFGLGLSVSCGVVAATGVTNAGFNPIEDFLQTDAAVNPGSSGGALVDSDGRLLGMLSAIFASEGDGNIGVNFAVSAELLDRVTDSLIETGEVSYRSAGWRLRHASLASLAVSPAPGVAALEEDGPAALAGIEPGDRIVRIGQRDIRSPRDALVALALLRPEDSEVSVEVLREGTAFQAVLSFGDSQDSAQSGPAMMGDCPHPEPVCAMRQAVFPVSSFDPVGSAVRIGPDLLVTNRHVVGDRADAVVHTPAGPRGAVVVPSAYPGDLALLQVGGLPVGGAVASLAPVAPQGTLNAIGADIARQEIRVFEGGDVIAPPSEASDLARWHVTARMQPGVSGGALVDSTGALIGIATGGGDGRFEAIPLTDVLNLLAMRDAGDAAQVQQTLGQAFVACVTALDAVQETGPTAELAAVCAQANNAGQLLDAGRAFSQAGNFAQGAELHAQAVAQVPNSLNARISLLVSLQLGGRFDEMLPHARSVMEMAPDDAQVLRFAIQSGVWGGDPDLAEAGYQALLNADPRQAEAARRFIDNAPPAPPRR